MFGTIILLLIILLLLLGVVFFFTPPNKKPTQTNWTTENTKDTEQWFSPKRWITDKEIDWACKRMVKNDKIKILPAHQFYLVREINCSDFQSDDYIHGSFNKLPQIKKWNKEEELFTYLLSELTGKGKEMNNLSDYSIVGDQLVFIPINKGNYHWSLLVLWREE